MPSGLLTDYLGQGLLANRPATPDTGENGLAFWFATDTETLSLYDQFDNGWQDVAAGGGATTLALLTDVALTALVDGHVLTWNAASSKWKNIAPSGGGGRAVGSHRYWRLRAGGRLASKTYTAWSGIEFRTVAGGANVAVGGTVTFTTPQASSGPAGAIAGNGGSDYIQLLDDEALVSFVAYDFTAPIVIRQISIYPMSFDLTRTPNVHIIEASDDGISWFPVITHVTEHSGMTIGTRLLLPVPATIPF